MSSVYTLTVFIEKPLVETKTENILGANFSIAGHMWYRAEKYIDGRVDDQVDAGYTGHGVTKGDNEEYTGSPAYTSRTVQISAEAYNKLKVFADPIEAARLGFGPNDYNAATNSCVDYVYKGLELADLNPRKIQGDLSPMKNLGFLEATLPPHIDPVVASQASTAPSLDPAAALTVPTDAPERISSNYITTSATDTHAVVIGKGGTVWDAYKTQAGSANGLSDWSEFKAAVATSNPNIADLNQVPAGATLYLPQKMSDGSVTYYYENGASVNNHTATGAYYMVAPNEEGGQTIYSRQPSAGIDDSGGIVTRPLDTIFDAMPDQPIDWLLGTPTHTNMDTGAGLRLDGSGYGVQLPADWLGAQLDAAAQSAQDIMAANGGPLSGTQLLPFMGMGLSDVLPSQDGHSLHTSTAGLVEVSQQANLAVASAAASNTATPTAPDHNALVPSPVAPVLSPGLGSAAAKPSDATALLADNMHAPYREVDLAPAPICLPPASEAAPPLLWTLGLDPALLNTQADILVSSLTGAPAWPAVSVLPAQTSVLISAPSLYTPPAVLAASVL